MKDKLLIATLTVLILVSGLYLYQREQSQKSSQEQRVID